MLNNDDLLNTAIKAAKAAGKIQLDKFGSLLNVDQHLRNDIKLEADRLCEQAIIATIKNDYPDHTILAEESGKSVGSDYIWYVDPLDGTVNFYYGLPYFCTTLACYYKPSFADNNLESMGEPLAAALFAPYTNELYTAAKGKGAFLNNRQIKVRDEQKLEDCLVITAVGMVDGGIERSRDYTLPLAAKVRKIRNMGAGAYDIANVAAGRASAFFERGVKVWDWAAGQLLVREAGGLFSGWQYDDDRKAWAILASGSAVHEELLPVIADEK